jgi:hypothetical protein
MNGETGSLATWLREAYADPAAGCPPPEAFLEAEMAALPGDERRRLTEHAEHCAACTAEWELARLFDAVPQGRVVQFPSRQQPAPSRRTWQWAAAAMLVLTAGLFQLTRPVAPPLPAPQAGEVRGSRIELVAPLGDVPAVPAELRWEPVAGAAAYRMRLLAVDDVALWEIRVNRPAAPLPANVASRLQRAVTYRWTVEALAEDGRRLAVSEPGEFRVPPVTLRSSSGA